MFRLFKQGNAAKLIIAITTSQFSSGTKFTASSITATFYKLNGTNDDLQVDTAIGASGVVTLAADKLGKIGWHTGLVDFSVVTAKQYVVVLEATIDSVAAISQEFLDVSAELARLALCALETTSQSIFADTDEMTTNGVFMPGTKNVLDDLNDLSIGDIQGEIQNGVLAKRIVITGDPFTIVEGTVKTLEITLGVEWDLTGKFVYFVMSKQNSSDAPIVNRKATILDAINGLAEIDLLTTETTPKGCYDYQVELRNDPVDDEPETAMEGTAEVTENLRL